MKNKKKILVLIPTRLNSRRLPAKALLPINNLPLIMHVYKRVKLSKKIDEAIICCDDIYLRYLSSCFARRIFV